MFDIFITFASLFLAFLAIASERVEFRIKTGYMSEGCIYSLIALFGTISILNSLFISSMFKNFKIMHNIDVYVYNHMLGIFSDHTSALINHLLLISYQIIPIICYLLMMILILYLIKKSLFVSLFNSRNAVGFLNNAAYVIANGNNEEVRKITNELTPSVKKIFSCLFSRKEEISFSAYKIIQLFSDEIFCKNVVSHNQGFLYEIFSVAIQHCDDEKIPCKNLISRLSLLLFTEKNSLLHREEEYHGLGNFSPIRNLIFKNRNFLISAYSPLLINLSINLSDLSKKAIDKYFDMFIVSLDCYLNCDDNKPDVFYYALADISDILITKNDEVKSSCCSSFISLVIWIKDNWYKFPKDRGFDRESYAHYKSDPSIYSALAAGIFKIVEKLSIIPISEDAYGSIRVPLLYIYNRMNNEKSKNIMSSIANRLDVLVEDKLKINLDPEYPGYPAMSSNYIRFFGLCEPEYAKLEIHKTLLLILKENFVRLYINNSKIAMDMIPGDVKFDQKANKLIKKIDFQLHGYSKNEELILDYD